MQWKIESFLKEQQDQTSIDLSRLIKIEMSRPYTSNNLYIDKYNEYWEKNREKDDKKTQWGSIDTDYSNPTRWTAQSSY